VFDQLSLQFFCGETTLGGNGKIIGSEIDDPVQIPQIDGEVGFIGLSQIAERDARADRDQAFPMLVRGTEELAEIVYVGGRDSTAGRRTKLASGIPPVGDRTHIQLPGAGRMG
jgi:hypothetical protein